MTARGIRNNNPGNIRHGADWQGMSDEQTDPSFIQFKSPEWGIRAMARIFRTYVSRGFCTTRQIINRWAPPDENDTESYIQAVAASLGVIPSQPLELDIYMPGLIAAVIRHENGEQPYTAEQIAKGISLA